MTDILDRIDAATAELCACGCSRPLDPDGPSGWWATELCQQIWQRGDRMNPGMRVVRLPDGGGLAVDPEAVRAAMAQVAAGVARLFEDLGNAIRPLLVKLADTAEQMRAAGMIGETLPADPMERALYLRKHRNTGPKQQQRAPRRIDARRSR